MVDIPGTTKLLEQFKKLISSGSHQKANDALTEVKLKVVQLQGLPPMLQDTPTREQELMIARDMLEHSVFLAVSLQVCSTPRARAQRPTDHPFSLSKRFKSAAGRSNVHSEPQPTQALLQ